MKKHLFILLSVFLLSSCVQDEGGTFTCVVGTRWTRDFIDINDEFWGSGSFKATIAFVSREEFKLLYDDSEKTSGTFDYNCKLRTGILRTGTKSLPFEVMDDKLIISIGKEKYMFNRIE